MRMGVPRFSATGKQAPEHRFVQAGLEAWGPCQIALEGCDMVGAIVKRDVVAHPIVTIRCFGWRVFIRALLAGGNTTFLSLLTDSETLRPAGGGVPEFVGRCVELELKASRIYKSLARRFADQAPVREFFNALTRQENAHAELLELAETAAGQERWDESKAAPWRSVIPRLEVHMEGAVSVLDEIHSVKQALQHVIEIESSEINDVFNGVIAASDSCFVRRIRTFHQTEVQHLQFICRSIERIEPDLVPACQVLSDRVREWTRA